MSERQLATVCTNPFRVDRIIHEWQQGETLLDILAAVQPNRALWAGAHVFLGDIEIKPEYYHVVHPRPDVLVTIKILPHGDDILRSVAFIALAVASAKTGGLAGAIFGGGVNASPAAIALGVSTAVFVGGSLLINAMIPLDTPALDDGDDASQALSVGASRNRLNPFGNLTTLLGFHRFAPNFAAAPYTDLDGQDQSVVMLFTVGFKNVEVDISSIRVGNTPITSYEGVTAEYLTGGSGDNVGPGGITIYKNLAFEDVVNKQIPGGNTEQGYAQQSTSTEVDQVQFEIHFPYGLVFYQGDGDLAQLSLTVTVEWATSLVGPWDFMTGPDFDAFGNTKFVAASQVPIRKSFQWTPPAQGQYHIRMRANRRNSRGPQIYNERFFAILRSFKYGSPVNDPDVSQIALRILATDQLNGTPDQITFWCQSIMPDYVGGTTWADGITNNPASIARWLLTGRPNARALDPSRLDGQSFIDFWNYCVAGGYTYNQVIDFNTSINDTINRVCRAGFARIVQIDGFWKVIIDQPQTIVRQVFSPRNSWGFSATRSFPEIIEGFQVRFIEGTTAQDDYANSEQIVYADGFSASNNTGKFESLETIGVTNWEHVWEFGRRYLAVAKLQPEVFTISVDAEHLVSVVNDLVEYQQDAIKVGLGAARVKAIDTTEVTLDAAMPMDGAGTRYAVQFRHNQPANFGDNLTTTIEVENQPGLNETLVFVLIGTYGEVGDLVTFGELGRINQQMLIKNIDPSTDLSARLTLLPYADGIYRASDGPIPDYDPVLTDPPGAGVPVISNIQSDEYVMSRDSAGVLQTRVVVSLAFVENRVNVQSVIAQWRVYSTIENNAVTWISLGILPEDVGTFIITDVNERAQIEIRTRFLFRDGTSSAWTYYYDYQNDKPYHTVIGKTNPPPDLALLEVFAQASGLREYRWAFDPATLLPPDLDGVEVRYFDTDDLATGVPVEYGLMDGDIYGLIDGDTYALQYSDTLPAWEDMTPLTIGRLYYVPFEYNAPFEGSWIFAVKAKDVGNLESVNAFYTGVVTLPAPQLGNSLFYIDHFSNNWFEGQTPGAIYTDCARAASTGYLQGITSQTWDSAGTWAGGGTWQGAPTATFTITQEPGLVPFDPAILNGNIRVETSTDTALSAGTFVFRYAINGGSFTGNEFVSGDIITNPGAGGFTSLEFQMEVTNAPAEGVRNWIVEGYASA